MSNIVWLRPDGGVSVTVMTPKALEAMAWARENRALLEEKDTLIAERDRLASQAGEARQNLLCEQLRLNVAQRLEESGAIAEAKELKAEVSVKLAELEVLASEVDQARTAVLEQLVIVERLEHVRDAIGFDEHEHELVLKRRALEDLDREMLAAGDKGGLVRRPAILDWVCVGHRKVLPADRAFRDAWTANGEGEVVHDMEKARAIHRDRIRAVRVKLLAGLDAAELAALRKGIQADIDAVRSRKQALLDAPADAAIAAASTPEELKAAWPAALTSHDVKSLRAAFRETPAAWQWWADLALGVELAPATA